MLEACLETRKQRDGAAPSLKGCMRGRGMNKLPSKARGARYARDEPWLCEPCFFVSFEEEVLFAPEPIDELCAQPKKGVKESATR